ncbi:MAG: winged helix-turn-helix domain-containing protein [Pseudomonadota bacterium]
MNADLVIGGVSVDLTEGLLSSSLGESRLEPKVAAVLAMLAENPGEIVSREQLHEAVWGETLVSDDALARCIYQIRSELSALRVPPGDDPLIETLRKRGYRLRLPVTETETPPSPLQTGGPIQRRSFPAIAGLVVVLLGIAVALLIDARRAPGKTQVSAIAVLPFLNLTGDPGLEYLADGFSEQLSHHLANVKDLRVAARTSAFFFKDRAVEIPDIARQLEVGALVEGSIRIQGEEIRVTVQLVRDDGFHLWSREYDRQLIDTVSLQSEISDQVLAELGFAQAVSLPARSLTTSYRAQDLNLRGRYAMAKQDYDGAVELFQAAVSEDPDYALAYTGIADALSLKQWRSVVRLADDNQTATVAIDQALALSPNLAEAHASQGLFFLARKEYAEAEPPLRKALRLNPNYVNAANWLGLSLVYQNRFAEASEVYAVAQRLNPMDLSTNKNLGANLLLSGRVEGGMTYLKRVQEQEPESLHVIEMIAHWQIAYGAFEGALLWAEKGLKIEPDHARLSALKGSALYHLGRWDSALRAIDIAREEASDDNAVLETTLALAFASSPDRDFQSILKRELERTNPDQPVFGRAWVLLRWEMMDALARQRPDHALSLADRAGATAAEKCGAFGSPGPRIYRAAAFSLLGQTDRALTDIQTCLEQVQQVIDNGGEYPLLVFRLATTQLEAGQNGEAAQTLERAINLGWRHYHTVIHDPLWRDAVATEPFKTLLKSIAPDTPSSQSNLGLTDEPADAGLVTHPP